MPLNPAETLVHHLCQGTFLSLYSMANPSLKRGKELCDLLVVHGADIIIWSVKDIQLKDGESSTNLKRWRRKAIMGSARQLYGAERQLALASEVPFPSGGHRMSLPSAGRRVHRVAVALGSKGLAVISDGDFGKGFVHVLDERSLETLLQELDTVTDFVNYLQRKESFLGETQVVQTGGEEDLLAIYLQNGRSFPYEADLLMVQEGHWDDLRQRPEWIARKHEDVQSYAWDRIVETFMGDFLGPGLATGQSIQELDSVTRVMAGEDRFARRVLSKAFLEFMEGATAGKLRSRIVPSPSGVVYVFLATPRSYDREARQKELGARCFVARGVVPGAVTVIGLATEVYEGEPGFSFDAARFTQEVWSAEDEARLKVLQAEFGLFHEPELKQSSEKEYPDPQARKS